MSKVKLKWKKEPGTGNVKNYYRSKTVVRGDELTVMEIREFKKGEFCLPEYAFKRNKKFMCQKTKSISLAKRKCEKWFNDFIKAINPQP